MLEKPSLPRALGGVGSEGFLLFGRLLIANFRWDKLSRLIFFRIWMPLLPKYLAAFTLASTLPSAKSPSGCQGLDVNFYHPLMGFNSAAYPLAAQDRQHFRIICRIIRLRFSRWELSSVLVYGGQ
ncbi:hypothetical protein VE30_00925 [Vreelandella aquamarina]|jgi:hypothetical protein|nr:hypothetical protein VE30_00925 [Halomonas meridiana]|tara:strand:+ start:188 stop:562 length:375 start_codon:yes stop_codon:yes gene_type:complete